MKNHALLTESQLQTLLESGPELDRLEPLLSPELRSVMIALQRNAADAYAAGEWTVANTGEKITVPPYYSNQQSPMPEPSVATTQHALGNTYLSINQQADASRMMLKSIMDNLKLNPSVPGRSANNQSIH